MTSSNIYEMVQPPQKNLMKDSSVLPSRSRRRRSFDSATNRNHSSTHRRRRKNRGIRRFLHQMKKDKYSKKIWTSIFSTLVVVLTILIIWDRFFR